MGRNYVLVPKDVKKMIDDAMSEDGMHVKGISIDMVKRMSEFPKDHPHYLPSFTTPNGIDGRRYFHYEPGDVEAWIARNRPEDD